MGKREEEDEDLKLKETEEIKLGSETGAGSISELEDTLKADKIELKIHKARDLEKKGMFGKVDAYVQIKINDQTFKTETIKNNQNPEWNYVNSITFKNPSDIMEITVFDEDIGRDDFLGTLVLNVQENKDLEEQWMPLKNCKSGEILLTAKLQNNDNEKSMIPIMEQNDIEKDDSTTFFRETNENNI